MKVFMTSRAFLILSFLWLLSLPSYAFFQNAGARVKTKYEFTDTRISEADTLLKKREYQRALEAYQKAYEIYEAESFYEGMVYAKERVGYTERRLGLTQKSLESFVKAKEIAEGKLPSPHILTSKVLLSMGIRVYRQTAYTQAAHFIDSAMLDYQKSFQYDSLLLKQLVNYKYYSYLFANLSMDTVVRYLNERGRILDISKSERVEEVNLLSDYSRAYFESGDFQKAAAYALESVRISEENLNDIPAGAYSNALFNLGRSLQLQDEFKQALSVADKLIEFTERENPTSNFLLGYYNLRAVALNGLEEYMQAANQFRKIMGTFEKRNQKGFFYRNAIMNLGVCYQLMGDYDLAEKYLTRALHEERNERKEFDIALSDRYKYLGQLNNSLGKFDRALSYYDSALKSNISFSNLPILEFPPEDDLEESFDILNILKNKQANMKELYSQQDSSSNMELLLATIDHAERTHRYLMSNRESLQASSGKLFLSRSFKTLYENGIDAAYTLFKQGVLKDENFRRAFSFFAYSKSILFIEQSGELGRIQDERLPVSFSKRYYELNTEIDQLEERFNVLIDQVANNDSLRMVNMELMKRRTGLEQLKDSISTFLGNELSGELINPTEYFDQILDYSKSERALVEFFVGENHIYILGINNDTRVFEKIDFTVELEKAIWNLISVVSSRPSISDYQSNLREYQNAAFIIYEGLLSKPLSCFGSGISKLKIIPDELLSKIPFESIVSKEEININSFRNLNYLINKVSISYSLSSTEIIADKSEKKAKKNLFGVGYSGDVISQERSGYGALPGTEREIEYLKSSIQGDYFLGQDGSRNIFLEKARNYDILHLAIHGEADSSNRYQSRLIFNGEDGILRTSDLYAANLSARLAILSACESGVGQINKGEGTFSIARGFALVGVQTIVMSLWKVNDKVASELMVDFHNRINEGDQINDALTSSKRRFLEEADKYTSHPYYWSAFVSLGENVSLKEDGDNRLLIVVTILLLGFILLALKKKRGIKPLP